ncbi:MAG TPA: malto-oligosyltrehalose trehalohydrolase [Candidatus Udaeobacter sp.]|nr:malto-oligosyltrehalose trehalohydrolase [Candidatus Udaeobacter sp.]
MPPVRNKFNRVRRRYPIGAELIDENKTDFRVWAPKAREVDVAVENASSSKRVFYALTPEPGGYFCGTINVAAHARYQFRLNGDENCYPDPASRFQPDGPHGSSCVIDSATFHWTDSQWPGVMLKGEVIYEMHIGTFTKEGTWRAAAERLEELARIGVTVIEMMPIADFPGQFGWGYDGVNFFAPCHLYGTPHDLRAFINCAHSLHMGVILDVVYNHFGPDGNYLGMFSDDYLVREKENEWGNAINFDGSNSQPVREFFITNGCYWIEEFHFDGFRFDATHAIRDESTEYIIGAVGRAAREAAGKRSIILVAENDLQEAKMARPLSEGGDGLDAMWNDDFHHSAVVALAGRNQAYFADYSGTPQEFISAAKYGFLYQGQALSWRKALRGTSTLGTVPEAFVCFLENHDQIANTGTGERLRFQTSPGRYRAMTALLLLGPWTPLLFQGQEFGASSPFLFFSDIGDASVREAIRKGRAEWLAAFLSLSEKETLKEMLAPDDPEAFVRCKLDFAEREKSRQLYDLHIDLLTLRRKDSRFRQQSPRKIDGAVLGRTSFILRYFSSKDDDRLLLVNLGAKQALHPASEPLLAPPSSCAWQTQWTSDSPRYGGAGAAAIATPEQWLLPTESAVVLRPVPDESR